MTITSALFDRGMALIRASARRSQPPSPEAIRRDLVGAVFLPLRPNPADISCNVSLNGSFASGCQKRGVSRPAEIPRAHLRGRRPGYLLHESQERAHQAVPETNAYGTIRVGHRPSETEPHRESAPRATRSSGPKAALRRLTLAMSLLNNVYISKYGYTQLMSSPAASYVANSGTVSLQVLVI